MVNFLKNFKHSKYVFLIGIIDKITFFLFFLTIARLNTEADYGKFIIITVFFNIISPIFDLGFKYFLQREAASNNEVFSYYVNIIFSLKVLFFIIYLFLGVFYLFILLKLQLLVIVIFGSLLFILNFIQLFNQIYYGLNEYYYPFKIHFFIRFLIIVFCFINLFFIKYADIQFLISIFLFLSLLHILIITNNLKKFNIQISFKIFSFNEYFKIVQSSYLLGISLIFVLIYDKIDVQILYYFIDIKIIAFYSIAYSFYKFPQIFSNSILVPAYSNFCQDFSKKHFDWHKIKTTFFILIGLASFVLLFYQLTAYYIIKYIYGDKYLLSSIYLKILSIGIFFYFANNFTGVFLNSLRMEKITAKSTLYATILNILANLLLLFIFRSIYSAIISSIITELFIFVYQLFYIQKNRNVFNEKF
ncbi:MAG TPA: oligosaccharide flippase family protein [Ignavibacteriales bacterium]|nr:oligosaccharide flippase family protein [Ignavibacteriales bacterium]